MSTNKKENQADNIPNNKKLSLEKGMLFERNYYNCCFISSAVESSLNPTINRLALAQ